MPVAEADLELLETYLDDELASPQAEALRQRLSAEPGLADALEQLRFERDARKQYFSALEPADDAVQRLLAGVHRQIGRERVWTLRARALRSVSGVAACLLVGFGGGYLFRGASTVPSPASNNDAVVNSLPNREIVFPETGNAPRVARPGAATPGGNTKLVGYEVSLTDDAGNVIGVQRFPTLEQARNFAGDVTRWRKEHNQLTNGGVRLIGDQF
jgi:anti-sigma factor RsiW